MSQTQRPEDGKYVYCIVRATQPFDLGPIGIGGAQRVFSIPFRDLAAVVSDTPVLTLDSTRENVRVHEQVNERVMAEFCAIPISFGTVFRSADEVTELLRSTYQSFSDVLDRVNGKVEFDLRVTWDRDRVISDVQRANDSIQRLQQEINRNATSSTYFARMQLSRLIDVALEERSALYVAEIHEALKQVSVASRSNAPVGDRMIVNSAFLVERMQAAAFEERVRVISAPHEGVLAFTSVGPRPPYNFVNIKLKLDRAD